MGGDFVVETNHARSVLRQLAALPADSAAALAASAVERACSNPYRTASGQLVRCGSRFAAQCPSCSRLAVGDWSTIFRSGIFTCPPGAFRFLFVTLTAPSFGKVHYVPQSGCWRRCDCGSYHRPEDEHLRGVPVDPDAYDYYSAVRWNRDIGLLWANTRRMLVDLLPGAEYAKVYEMQARQALHAHVILRVPASVPVHPDQITDVISRVTASSTIDGMLWSWGTHGIDIKPLTAELLDQQGNLFARTSGYMAKMISYVAKSIHTESRGHREHTRRMHEAAHAMGCEHCPPANSLGFRPPCKAGLHRHLGARQGVVSTSRSGRTKPGWSLTRLTRQAFRAVRQQYMVTRSGADGVDDGAYESQMLTAAAGKQFLNRLSG